MSSNIDFFSVPHFKSWVKHWGYYGVRVELYLTPRAQRSWQTPPDTLPSLLAPRLCFYHWSKYPPKLVCSSFIGEYYELEQRRFPRQPAAQSTKCSQHSRNAWREAGLGNVCLLQVAWGGTMCWVLRAWKCHSGRRCSIGFYLPYITVKGSNCGLWWWSRECANKKMKGSFNGE